MRSRKRLSPFEKLFREIEGCMADLVYQSQLNALANKTENWDFVRGQCVILRYLLERAYAIRNSRSIGNELVDMPFDEWLETFRAAIKKEDW